MQQFLIIYNRREGRIIRHRHFRGSESALAARFAAEAEFLNDSDVEIVVLGAESWEAVQNTHSRYFKPVHELAEAALEREARLS